MQDSLHARPWPARPGNTYPQNPKSGSTATVGIDAKACCQRVKSMTVSARRNRGLPASGKTMTVASSQRAGDGGDKAATELPASRENVIGCDTAERHLDGGLAQRG
jgi:hypothetical protein